mmetsp:Transcript_34671/g.63255  ORF Transcript_34671/g.63255 Transcript_34671/m.63255 type:complete len:102 (+) Transcript_34671:58-363(+)
MQCDEQGVLNRVSGPCDKVLQILCLYVMNWHHSFGTSGPVLSEFGCRAASGQQILAGSRPQSSRCLVPEDPQRRFIAIYNLRVAHSNVLQEEPAAIPSGCA